MTDDELTRGALIWYRPAKGDPVGVQREIPAVFVRVSGRTARYVYIDVANVGGGGFRRVRVLAVNVRRRSPRAHDPSSDVDVTTRGRSARRGQPGAASPGDRG